MKWEKKEENFECKKMKHLRRHPGRHRQNEQEINVVHDENDENNHNETFEENKKKVEKKAKNARDECISVQFLKQKEASVLRYLHRNSVDMKSAQKFSRNSTGGCNVVSEYYNLLEVPENATAIRSNGYH